MSDVHSYSDSYWIHKSDDQVKVRLYCLPAHEIEWWGDEKDNDTKLVLVQTYTIFLHHTYLSQFADWN